MEAISLIKDAYYPHDFHAVPSVKTSIESEETENVEEFGVLSNEPLLFTTFPYTKKLAGAGLGVGLDQMLDYVVNSELSTIYMTDVSPAVSTLSRSFLEIGRIHRFINKDDKDTYRMTPEKFCSYLDSENIGTTLAMLEPHFSDSEMEFLTKAFSERMQNHHTKESPPLRLFHYLSFKSRQKEYRSWMSDPETLERIFSLYESGNITVVRGDLSGPTVLPAIAKQLKEQGTLLSLVYESNARNYIEIDGNEESLEHNCLWLVSSSAVTKAPALAA
ncbi:MAG: hypothetical protein V4480_04975 [Patescibacteria group bacterium]